MVDKDFMAIKYSNANAEHNQLTNAKAILSNGFEHIDPGITVQHCSVQHSQQRWARKCYALSCMMPCTVLKLVESSMS